MSHNYYQGTYGRLGVTIYATNTAVIRAALRKLHAKARFHHRYRKARHAYLRDILRCHRDARALAGRFRL